MDKKKIQYLIQKHSSGELSKEELGELYRLMNEPELGPSIDTYSDQTWNSSRFDEKEVPPVIWESIKKSIIPTTKPVKKSYKIGIQFMKYAAVVCLTFGFAWLFFTWKSHNYSNQISYNEFRVPYGSKSSIILPDGTKIWMNSGSRIRYPEKFATTDRTIYLEGEAFFDVTHNEHKPFIVKTSDINIKVYGTKFNVKSFPEESIIETALVSGSVEIERTNSQGKVINNIKMKPNQIVSYSKQKGDFVSENETTPVVEAHKVVAVTSNGKENELKPIEPLTVMEVITSWKDEKLLFKKENFEDIIVKMQRWFNVKITLKNENLKNCTFTGTFDKETVEQALEALKLTYPFTYTINKNIIEIK